MNYRKKKQFRKKKNKNKKNQVVDTLQERTPVISHKRQSILLFSSLIFITNIMTTYYKEYNLYSFLFLILTITSLVVHSNDNIYTNLIDKFAVSCVVVYGAYILLNKANLERFANVFIIVALFLITIFLYVYGYFTKKYCFCNEISTAEKYHCALHIISSIGHHFIIFL
jgi:hypothetical protein